MEQKTKDEFITTALRAGVPKNQLVRFLGAKYIPLPWQMNFHAACREADLPGKAVDIGAGGARGPGKPLALDTIIPTVKGYTTMGEVKVGDLVFSKNGKPTKVTGLSKIKENSTCYKLTFSDGFSVVADAEHLWETYTKADRVGLVRRTDDFRAKRRSKRGQEHKDILVGLNTKQQPKPTIKTTQELVDTVKVKGEVNHAILVAPPLELPERELLIDPYLFGIWLGDGDKDRGYITCFDEGILDEIRDRGFIIKDTKQEGRYIVDGLSAQLRQLGMIKNKHIPIEYLRASKEQRLDLLCGLNDSDGYVDRDGAAEFTNTNKTLAENYFELSLTLGFRATKSKGRATLNGRVISDKYRIRYTGDLPAFVLSRKLSKQKIKKTNNTRYRYIVDIEKVESVPVRCITVADESHCFLIGKQMVTTHNSHGVFAQVTLDDCQRTKGLKALFLRQTGKAASESFEDLIRRVIAHKIKYKYNRSTNVLAFPNGSRVILGGFETDKDIDKYIGIEYDLIAIEERNQLTNDKIIKLKGSLRTSRDDWRPRMYSSFNPGGVGHGDLKNHFIIPNREGTEKKTKFIPATYRDNPYLNIEYVDYLESLTGDLGRMWRDGDWDIFAGQFFSEWRQDKHVIEPFAIPPTWKRVRSIDVSGRAGITSCHWYAIDYDGNVYAYREHYKTGLDSDQHAREIAKMGHSSDCPALTVLNKVGTEMGEVEKKEVENSLRGLSQYCMGKTCEKYPYTVIDASAFAKIGTPETIAELYIRNGVTDLVPSSKQRVMGWDFMHQYLRWEEVDDPVAGKITIGPKLKFFNTCTEAIRSIPTLIHDDKNPEDLNTRGDDHVADEARYFLQTLRESASPKPMSFVERRLMEMNSTNF